MKRAKGDPPGENRTKMTLGGRRGGKKKQHH